jgi:tetratricopeptide (TPR) repeat protein
MSTAFQRGIVLYQQSRYDLADRAFREELAQAPENGPAHAFLALCLAHSKKIEDAARESELAVQLEPAMAFCHYVRGFVLCDQSRYSEAEAAARRAIELEPADADFRGLLGSIELGRRRWDLALEAANSGLALDPEHHQCTNIRALALVQLGRRDEAAQTLGSALANDPHNALTHCNQGWALLHSGNHRQALEHFREALRIDPELEWAQAGIVEALKAHHLIYRWMLRFFLWMSRQSRVAQWVVILGFIFGRSALAQLARAYPALAPYIMPVLALSLGFLLLTWIASPLFNFVLRFNRFGRLALSRDQRLASTWIGCCFLLAAGFLLADLIRPTDLTEFAMIYFGLFLLPLTVTFGRPPGRARWPLAIFTAALAALGLPFLSLILLGKASPWKDVKLAQELFYPYFVLGCILCTWLPAVLHGRPADA